MSGTLLSPRVHLLSKLIYLILILSTFTGKEIQTLTQGLANLKTESRACALQHGSIPNKAIQGQVLFNRGMMALGPGY